MSEHDDDRPADAGPPPRAGWRERAYGFRAVAAVAVAGLVIGGGAGAAIHAATGDDGHDGGPGRMGFGGPGGPGGGPGGGQLPDGLPGDGQFPAPPNGMPGGPPPGIQGQVPSTPPGGRVDPDAGDTTSGDTT